MRRMILMFGALLLLSGPGFAQVRHAGIRLEGNITSLETGKALPDARVQVRKLGAEASPDTLFSDSAGKFTAFFLLEGPEAWQILVSDAGHLPLTDTLIFDPDSLSGTEVRNFQLAPDVLNQLEEIIPVSIGGRTSSTFAVGSSLDANLLNLFYRLGERLEEEAGKGIHKRLEVFPLLSSYEEKNFGARLAERRGERIIREMTGNGIPAELITQHPYSPELKTWFEAQKVRGVVESEGSIVLIGLRTLP